MRGDLPILAALLGVGVVVSPLVSGRAGEAATSALGTAPRSAPATIVAGPASAPRPAIAQVETTPRETPLVKAATSELERAPRAPIVVEGVEDPGLATLGVIADRPFALVLGEAGLARPTRVDGPLTLDGRPVLLHVAASWCAPCVEDLPTFLALAAVAPRVVMVAAEDVAGPSGLLNAVEALVARAEPSSRALPLGLELRADPSWSWAAWLGRDTLPLTAVIDARGRLVMLAEGALDADAAARVAMHLEVGP